MPTNILLIRHGETAWNRDRIFRGTHDVPLNDTGRLQARLLGEALKDRSIDAAYSSPLSRAVETARLALAGSGVEIRTEPRLRDFSYGRWQTLSEAEVARRWPARFQAWMTTPAETRPPGGDTLAEVRAAAFGAMEELAARHDGQTIALFAHRVVNKLLVLSALSVGLERFAFIRQDNCCCDEFQRTPDGYVVISLNDTSHLRGRDVKPLSDDF